MVQKGLFERLAQYRETDFYPYHMPGHKRKRLGALPEELTGIDITEIDGFDNLHQAKGILLDLQREASRMYGADETFYLINGSTGGILSAVSAAVPEGGHLLMARGCHRSAYHAAYLRRLKTSYLIPPPVEGFEFYEAVNAEEVEQALKADPDIGAVLIVSPTYEGRIADVRAIVKTVHRYGIPLIVDEAHGAHLGFAPRFAEGSCTCGADLVIHSVHKTLPALTQTALLHVNGDLIDRDRLRRFLHIYQSSSPSYVLMAGIGDALDIVADRGRERFERFRILYDRLINHLKECKNLRFIPVRDVEQGRQDVGKLVIAAKNLSVPGKWIYDTLREKYHLQCEMAAGGYCLAMFTIADEEDAYCRMEQALLEMDRELSKERPGKAAEVFLPPPVVVCSLAEAWDGGWEIAELSYAVGHPSADFVNLYPPGCPILAPGELVTEEICRLLGEYHARKLTLQGVVLEQEKLYLKILRET